MNNIISIIVPCYKCAPFIKELSERVLKLDFSGLTTEIIFVNDNSPMEDWRIIKEQSDVNPRIKGINLSRNFGQHYAIYAGLENASGDWIVVMDGDLQDQPEEIINLLSKAEEGYDMVFASREDRKDGFFKKLSSKYFYKILSYLTDTNQDPSIANFGIYHRKVIQAVIQMNDYVRYFPTMVRWVGFRQATMVVEHAMRNEGSSGYNLRSLLKLALNVILSFSDKPLRLTVKLGLTISFFSVFAVIIFLYQSLTGNIEVLGYSSIIISIWMFSGVIITLIGISGLYIGRIFDQVKNRPKYIISDKLNFK